MIFSLRRERNAFGADGRRLRKMRKEKKDFSVLSLPLPCLGAHLPVPRGGGGGNAVLPAGHVAPLEPAEANPRLPAFH